jgi:hypothetical protein
VKDGDIEGLQGFRFIRVFCADDDDQAEVSKFSFTSVCVFADALSSSDWRS